MGALLWALQWQKSGKKAPKIVKKGEKFSKIAKKV